MDSEEEQLRQCGDALAAAIEQALPDWTVDHVERLMLAWHGAADPAVLDQARVAGAGMVGRLLPDLRALFATDVDDHRTNPLAILRSAVGAPTEILLEAGVPPVERDETAERQFPADRYDLTPAAFAEFGPEVHEHGLAWGAAKAFVVLRRRRAEGQR